MDAKQSLHVRFMAINETMMQIKLNKRNKATVNMSKQRGVLNHIHHEISKSIYHIWIHFAGTVWPPSASNISVERTHVIWVPRELCPLLFGRLVWSPNEPNGAHTAGYDVLQRWGVRRHPPSKNPGLPRARYSELLVTRHSSWIWTSSNADDVISRT